MSPRGELKYISLNENMSSEEKLAKSCRMQEWDKARVVIAKDPLSICTSRDDDGYSPVYWAAWYGDLKMLQHMLDAVLSFWPPGHLRQWMLRIAFERGNGKGETPAYVAAQRCHLQCLMFLVEHSPSGASVLEAKEGSWWTPAHWACFYDSINTLNFIVRNAPSGARVLEVKSYWGKKPLDIGSSCKKYFTPQKIREIATERELELIKESRSLVIGPFVSLIFDILQQNSALI